MGPVEALEIAVRRENDAAQFYQKLSIDYPEIKETLLFLVGEEQKHKELLEGKIRELING